MASMNQICSIPRVSVSTFLSTAKEVLSQYNTTSSRERSQLTNTLTFVIGNESADLDSICCTIIFAYSLTYFSNVNRSLAASIPATFHIPLLNIQRTSLRLRPELTAVLQHANLKSSELLTLSDLPQYLPPPEQTRWLLVDHNVLTGGLGKIYGHRVVGCIDHHEDEGLVPFGDKIGEGLEGEPRVIEKASSCASLVTAWVRNRWQSAMQGLTIQNSVSNESEDRQSSKWRQEDARLARLALAPILIDSACLKSAKTETKDISSSAFLEQLIMRYEVNTYNRTEFFNEISAAKQDLSSLFLTDILRKDYKQWTECSPEKCSTFSRIGIAAVVQPMVYLLAKAASPPDFLQILFKFAQEKDLSLLAIMTTSYSKNKEFQRELLVWGLDERGVQAGRYFKQMAAKKLGLQKWVQNNLTLDLDNNEEAERGKIHTGTSWRHCWVQLDTESSRKQVAPLMRAAMKRTMGTL
ncbi:putative exopolyphosphatase [Golovinomyces cichoracearum]|uniref:Putative exopolyphosphatase n=1 Tax=Golovinomyces cichoracearum TaxID=62708 RepID=A0A420J059_9PEZI|nr:putative exopolyphosphatase [Golovinomyces cichoracearum]